MACAVLTRDPADTETYAAALRPLGLEVVAMPVTRPAAAADPEQLTRAIANGPFAFTVVASPRAAHELVRALGNRDAKQLGEVWAVGPATRRALDIAKLASKHPEHVRDGVELAKELVSNRVKRGQRILVPRAQEGRVEALDILRAAGAEVVDVVAYRTVAVPATDPAVAHGAELLRSGQAVVCFVFAPSQATALVAIMGPLGALTTKFCAIGTTTAGALRSAGIDDIAVAATPTPAGIAAAARTLLA